MANIKKELKEILKEYKIPQNELYYKFGFHFNEITAELLEDVKRQLNIKRA